MNFVIQSNNNNENFKARRVDILVLAYNGGQELVDCVASVYEHTPLSSAVRLKVLDNNSTDGSLAEVEQQWPDLEIVYIGKNLGFGPGNNVGIRLALADGADAVVLLNQDTIVESGWFENLLLELESDKVGIAQSLLVLVKDPDVINSWGNDLHVLGFGTVGGYGERLSELKKPLVGGADIPYAMGACMAVKREVLETAGLFDEEAFMYHDDMDVCLRTRLLGWRVVLAADSRVRHNYTDRTSAFTYKWLEVNRLWNVIKFYHWPTLLILFPLWLFFEVVGFGYAVTLGFVRSWGQARALTIKKLPHLIRCRRRIQRTRVISDRELLRTARASFPQVRASGSVEKIARQILSIFSVVYWKIVSRLIFW